MVSVMVSVRTALNKYRCEYGTLNSNIGCDIVLLVAMTVLWTGGGVLSLPFLATSVYGLFLQHRVYIQGGPKK